MSDSPRALGFRMPAEWEPQEAIWLSWPAGDKIWPDKLALVERKFAEIAATISRFEAVRINAPKTLHDPIHALLKKTEAKLDLIELFPHPNNDVWCRDHGPIFVVNANSRQLAVTDWGFNGWGDKFRPYDLDNEIPRLIAESLGLPRFEGGMILEGGAIEVNSRGQLLTTEAVLLNENRNRDMSRRQIEERLRDMLGVWEVFWLGSGIEGDDTDGHVDDIARFVNDETVLLSWERDSRSPNYKILHENRDRLQDFRSPSGSRLEIIEIPLPPPCRVPNWRLPVLPASHVNFLIVNDAVLVPTFGDRRSDMTAVGMLNELFGSREIVPIDCLDLVREGGSLHCISQQQPAIG